MLYLNVSITYIYLYEGQYSKGLQLLINKQRSESRYDEAITKGRIY